MSMGNSTIDPKILGTHRFNQEFGNCLRRKPTEIKIVVPFLGESPYGNIVRFAFHLRRKNCALQLITRKPSAKAKDVISPDDALKLHRMQVDLVICSRIFLHSKIYQFCYPSGNRVGFVGSANFSNGGFKSNVETVAFFQSDRDNDRVADEISRIYSYGNPYRPPPHRVSSRNGKL